MKRKIISAALALVMLLSVSASAVSVMPLWDNARNCEANGVGETITVEATATNRPLGK